MNYRLTEDDLKLGPITWGKSSGGIKFRITLESGNDEYPGACLMVWALGRVMRIWLPRIVRPRRRWVSTADRPWSESPDSGYWEWTSRVFGLCLGEAGHFQIFYGAQSEDTDKGNLWSCFLPWTQWRRVRETLYDQSGDVFLIMQPPGEGGWQNWLDAKKECPKVEFLIEDFDGSRIVAKTHIDEHEWRLGEGWFKWLSWFRRPRIDRSLMIEFADEVGPEKGSWKGGLIGHSIEMLPDELHADAFQRYCEKEHNAKGQRYRIRLLGPWEGC